MQRDTHQNISDKICSDYLQKTQITTMLNREKEEWVNSQLNPTEIVATDSPTQASTGGRATSIQDKGVNFTSKITESKFTSKITESKLEIKKHPDQ